MAVTLRNNLQPAVRRRFALAAAATLSLLANSAANAHFQLLYTPQAALVEAAQVPLALVFAHPFDNGIAMDMGRPEAFYMVHQRGDAEARTTDLMQFLQPVQWAGGEGKAAAFVADLPRSAMRSLGDYTFVLKPAPYYEAQEDKYIQQITKTLVNVGGIPGDWDKPLGLPAEIVPLDKPYANWVGGVFRGVVMSGGKPVPFAEIEVEYLNHEPQMDARRFDPQGKVKAPQNSFGTLSIRADANGQVTIGLPKAGWWGICALDLDDDLQHQGKELSVDAVLWVQATQMGQ